MAQRYAVWSLADSRSTFALSGSNKIVDAAAGNQGTAKGSVLLGSGKYYFEVKVGASNSVASVRVGVVDQGHANTSGPAAAIAGKVIELSTGSTVSNGTTTAFDSAYTNGDVVMVAVDLTSGKVWFGKNGSWLQSGDPAAGTFPALTGAVGASTSSSTDTWWAVAAGRATTTGTMATLTLRCDPADLQYSLPSGFAAWGSQLAYLDSASSFGGTLTEGLTAWNAHPTIANTKIRGSKSVSSGKWYWEVHCVTGSSALDYIGISGAGYVAADALRLGYRADGYSLEGTTGNKVNNNTNAAYGNSFTTNNVIQVALDMDIGAIWFGENGTWHNSATAVEIAAGTTTHAAFTGLSGSFHPAISLVDGTRKYRFNFGDNPFVGIAPSGFLSLTHAAQTLGSDVAIAMPISLAGVLNKHNLHSNVAISMAMALAVNAADATVHSHVAAAMAISLAAQAHRRRGAVLDADMDGPEVSLDVVTGIAGSLNTSLGAFLESSLAVTVLPSAILDGGMDGPELSLSVLVGVVAALDAAFAGPEAEFTARMGIIATLAAELGELESYLVIEVGDSGTYKIVSVNLSNGAVTEYETYNFNSLVEWNGRYYGADATGIFLLEGDDDADDPIDAFFTTGITDHGTGEVKNVSDAYLSGAFAKAVFSLLMDDGATEYAYDVTGGGFDSHKVQTGRGVKSRYFQYKVANKDGGELEVDEIDVITTALGRRNKKR
jgi:hypothetical protein